MRHGGTYVYHATPETVAIPAWMRGVALSAPLPPALTARRFLLERWRSSGVRACRARLGWGIGGTRQWIRTAGLARWTDLDVSIRRLTAGAHYDRRDHEVAAWVEVAVCPSLAADEHAKEIPVCASAGVGVSGLSEAHRSEPDRAADHLPASLGAGAGQARPVRRGASPVNGRGPFPRSVSLRGNDVEGTIR